jgi:CDP-diacylglycerol--glycerol-3-phosphate 3-phosphatidyltransferase
MLRHLPNALTFFRMGAIPLIAIAMWLNFHMLAFVLYLLAIATDYLDGFIARRLRVTSTLGIMLDPIADKVLAACLLMILTAEQTIANWHLIPALIILAREVLVSGMREYLAGLRVALPVTFLAKIKTAFQFAALGLLILAPAVPNDGGAVYGGGYVLLWVAAAMTAYTGYAYLRAGLTQAALNGNGDTT